MEQTQRYHASDIELGTRHQDVRGTEQVVNSRVGADDSQHLHLIALLRVVLPRSCPNGVRKQLRILIVTEWNFLGRRVHGVAEALGVGDMERRRVFGRALSRRTGEGVATFRRGVADEQESALERCEQQPQPVAGEATVAGQDGTAQG